MDYKIKILGLLAWFIFFGCEKDDNIFPSGIYLKKVIYHREANQIRHYNYNKQGLLCSREYEFDDKITEKLLYHGSGNIEKAILFIDGYEHWKFAYRYDTKRNPFYEVDPIHDNFSGVDVIKYLSPNNVTFETFVNENNDTISEHEYIYAYNLFDLPAMSYE